MFGLHNTGTVYPAAIDARNFFSDVSLKHAEILNGYNELILNGQYKNASQYLYDNVEVADQDMDYNGAYLWNRLENRIVPLEQFVLSLPETDVRPHYTSTKPTNAVVKTQWIS